MKPKFDKNGQVCWLELSGLSALEASLTFKDFKDVVKRIIPTDKRGEKQQPFVVGQWATSKGEMIAILSYEEVGLLYSSAIEVFAFCEEPKMQSFDVSRVSNMLENQIGAYDSLKVDKAYIYWNKRKCQ